MTSKKAQAHGWLSGACALALLLSMAVAGAESLPAPIDRCPFTGRFPVEIALEHPLELGLLSDAKIDIDHVRGLTVTAYVDDDQLDLLREAGYRATAIPNAARRAWAAWKADPQREAYHDHAALTAELQQIASDHPDITMLTSIGASVQGRELWIMKISDNVASDEPEPEFKFTATMHGDEPPGTEMCVYLIRLLVEGYGTDPELTALVDDLEIWILPMHNPDGFESGSRFNANGYDLNRTFPDPRTDPYDDPTARPLEVQHMMYFQYAHNFILGANYHTGALVVNYPWDTWDGQYTPDDTMIRNLALGYAYRNPPMWNSPYFTNGVTIGWDWYVIDGGMQDWAYHWRNEMHYTIEMDDTKWPSSTALAGLWDDNRDAMLWLIDQARIGVEGFVTDATNGDPVKATVAVAEIGKDVWGEPLEGYYHRLLEPGSYTLTFSAPSYQDYVASGVTVSAGATTRLDVQLAREAWHAVSGTVSEAGSAAPLAATVAAYLDPGEDPLVSTTTNPATGAYTLEVPGGTYDFVAVADDHAPLTETRTISAPTTLDFALLPVQGELLVVTDNNPGPVLSDDLVTLGYLVTEETHWTTDAATWNDYDLLVWSAGCYKNPVQDATLRGALESYVAGGGTLLIEGGELGYDALQTPGYPTFAANVLHVGEFDFDNAGDLQVQVSDHPVATTPNLLPATLALTYDYFGDEDAVEPLPEATAVYGTTSYPGDAGVLVYDGAGRDGARIAFFAFDYNALQDAGTARELLENTLTHLRSGTQGVTPPPHATRFALGRPAPSVTRGATTLALTLPEAGVVRLDVYDATGRCVRILQRGELPAGVHRLAWNGRDRRGQDAPAGVYFLRAASPQGEVTRRVTIVE